jgi:hypothetical protein
MHQYKDEREQDYWSLDNREVHHFSVPMTFLIISKACWWDECHSNLTLFDVSLVNGTWLEAHFCKATCCDNSWLYQSTGLVCCCFLALGALILRIASNLLCIGWKPCLVIQYQGTSYSICSTKNLDLEMFTLIPSVESLVRTICNLSRWSLKLLFVNINKSSR